MLLSNEPHVHYQKNQLLEVICQVRFPAILKMETEEPAAFQDAIRKYFPGYSARQENPAPVITGVGTAHPTMQQQKPVTNHSFVSADGAWKINLTRTFISLSTVRYTNWEEFARRLDAPFAKFIQLYEPAYFERIGLRYVNAFSRDALQAPEVRWRDWIAPHVLGVLGEEDVLDTQVRKCATDMELTLPGGRNLKLHAGPGMVKRPGGAQEQRARFILDNDLSVSGKLTASQVAESLQLLHNDAYRVFRAAITDELHEALEPV